MITVEAWTTIRYLKEQGRGIRAIAREVGVARNTVRKALRSDRPPKYTRPPRPNPQLAPYDGLIRRACLERGFIGTRILRELRERGYEGSRSALYRYLARVRGERPDPRVSLRFETAPGRQGQFDWSPYTVELGGELRRVVMFCLTLGYSRRKRYFASLDGSQASAFEAIENGFHYFGGATKELLVDNDRAFVLDARPGMRRWNPRFLELCGHYRVQPVAARVGHARTKGKVERPFYYLEQHFIKGRSFQDFAHFCQELASFQEELDHQVHQTTQERPIDRFQRERPSLTPLPVARFVGSQEEVRKVSWDCLLSFRGSRYSVPAAYAGKMVWVRPSRGYQLLVFNQRGDLIASHLLSRRKGVTVLEEAHYEGLRRQPPRTRVLLEQAFLEHFPAHRPFLEKLYAQQRFNHVAHLRGILELATLFPRETLERAFALAHAYNTFSSHFIRGLLEEAPPAEPGAEGTRTLRPVPAIAVQGDLRPYQRLLTAGGVGHE
ncbi:MAG: IS21 family transposase [Anaerolineae bacterium]